MYEHIFEPEVLKIKEAVTWTLAVCLLYILLHEQSF